MIIYIINLLLAFTPCKQETAIDILHKTVETIDTVESVYYKQEMYRTNPRDLNDTLYRYREMYFQRLYTDSIVGVKGHWYMYTDNKVDIVYEDIYDGNCLIRKNNRDSIARLYDLEKYPKFKESHFWSHNTIYGMQYEFKYILNDPSLFKIERLNDTIISNKECYQISIKLEDKSSMPGFAFEPVDETNIVSETFYFIDKANFYPIGMYGLSYSKENPELKYFIDQKYLDIKFNLQIDESVEFDTNREKLQYYKIEEIIRE